MPEETPPRTPLPYVVPARILPVFNMLWAVAVGPHQEPRPVAAQIELGPYRLTLEPKGIRFSRQDRDGSAIDASPVLAFSLAESGQPVVWFKIHRLNAMGASKGQLHASIGQRIALDADLVYRADSDAIEFQTRIENPTEEMQIRLGVHFQLPGEADPRWMVPGFFYLNNKPTGGARVYPAYSEFNRDVRRFVSSSWAFRADRAATPMSAVWTYNAFAFIATEGIFGRGKQSPNGIGMSGLSFGNEDGTPYVGVEFPYREAPVKFSFCHDDRTEAEETHVLLPERTAMQATFSAGFGAPDLHAYAKATRGLYYQWADRHSQVATVPAERAEHTAHVGLLRWHYDARSQAIYESAAFDRHFGRKGGYLERAHMHAGWLSGMLPAYALLWAGRESSHEESVSAGQSVLDKFANHLAPCGSIFPVWTEENGWSCSFGPEDGTAHSRTVGEGVLFLLRAVALEMRHGANHPQWLEAALSSLRYAMGAQREDGCFPAYYDLTSGRPTSFEGCAGLAWVAALALGSSLLNKPHFHEVAVRGGEYYAQFVRNAFLYGSVEDQPFTPTSDDTHWALIAYMALYELDHDRRWLDLARKSADLALTWRMSWNVDFPSESMLARYEFRTRGGDIGSVACPTLGCNGLVIYRELLKLAAYVGDDYYRARADDSRLFASQLVVVEDGMLNARFGMVAGQLFHTDWWQPKGVVLTLSHAMAAGLVKHAELVRRNLNISRQTIQAASEGDDLPASEPVMYADTALSSTTASREVALPSGALNPMGLMGTPIPSGGRPSTGYSEGPPGGTSRGQIPSEFGSAGSRHDVATPVPAAPARNRGARGLSSENIPLPGFEQIAPVPFPAYGAKDEKKPAAPKSGATGAEPVAGDDEEIRYKIF